MLVLFDLAHALGTRTRRAPRGESEIAIIIIPIKKGVSWDTPDKEQGNPQRCA